MYQSVAGCGAQAAHGLSAGNVGEYKTVTLHDLAGLHADAMRENRRLIDERVKLAVLSAWIDRLRKAFDKGPGQIRAQQKTGPASWGPHT